jgi:hypothetical protein
MDGRARRSLFITRITRSVHQATSGCLRCQGTGTDFNGEGAMKKRDPWNRRAGATISVLYLMIFMLFEVYSATATALETNSRFPGWERLIGWVLFVLPGALLASLFLFHGRHPKLGFSIIIGNLCLYASFMVFESVAFGGTPVSPRTVCEVGAIWAALFLAAVLAARFLETRA